ncbi:MAG: hypothetical protein DRN49_07065 [Thaumarchaeota archaeon]|nr:MAG: hypothetical protein DRN49_07065 [Nitrososphaerota archaeon]
MKVVAMVGVMDIARKVYELVRDEYDVVVAIQDPYVGFDLWINGEFIGYRLPLGKMDSSAVADRLSAIFGAICEKHGVKLEADEVTLAMHVVDKPEDVISIEIDGVEERAVVLLIPKDSSEVMKVVESMTP